MPTVTLTVPWVRTSSLSSGAFITTSVSATLTPLTSFDQGYSLRTATASTDTYTLSTTTMSATQALSAQLLSVDFDFTFVVLIAFTLTASPGLGRDLILVRGRPFIFHSRASQDPVSFHLRVGSLPVVFHKRGVEILTIEQVLTPMTSFDHNYQLRTPTIAATNATESTTMTYTQTALAAPGVDFDFSVV